MALTRTISRLGAAEYGVNILEDDPPGQVTGVSTNRVAIVGEFPWGPESTPTLVDGASFFETFSPLEFQQENNYPGVKAFMDKTFPGQVLVVRVPVASAAAATKTFDDVSSGDSVVVTAKYKGAVGSQIRVTWAANATTAANSDLTVKVLGSDGTTVMHQESYENVVVDNTGSITVTDPSDPFVTVTAAGSATDVPVAVADSALDDTAGADGTVVIANYSTALDELADDAVEWDVVCGAEVPNSLIEDWNAALGTFMTANERGFAIASTPAGEAVATAVAAVASYRHDRIMRPWRRVVVINTFDPLRAQITVDGNVFAAIATASVDPEVSPGGANGAPFMGQIKGLETAVSATDAELASLTAAGITPFGYNTAAFGGAFLRNARTTDITSEDKRRVFRRRMVDFIAESISNTLAKYAERPLDLNLTTGVLGPITRTEVGLIRAFMVGLSNDSRIQTWAPSNLDPFGGNNQANIDAGQWILILRVKFNSMQEQTVLRLQAGTTVVVDEA